MSAIISQDPAFRACSLAYAVALLLPACNVDGRFYERLVLVQPLGHRSSKCTVLEARYDSSLITSNAENQTNLFNMLDGDYE